MDYIQLIEDNWAIVLTIIMIAPLLVASWSRWNMRTILFFGAAVASLVLDSGISYRTLFFAVMMLPLIYVTWRRETLMMMSYSVLLIALIAGV